jgi:hypothetical protein
MKRVCQEKSRLLREYQKATHDYTNAADKLTESLRDNKDDYQRLKAVARETFQSVVKAKDALFAHLDEHRCQGRS